MVAAGVNYINVLHTHISYEILAPKIQSCVLGLQFWRQKFDTKNAQVKR